MRTMFMSKEEKEKHELYVKEKLNKKNTLLTERIPSLINKYPDRKAEIEKLATKLNKAIAGKDINSIENQLNIIDGITQQIPSHTPTTISYSKLPEITPNHSPKHLPLPEKDGKDMPPEGEIIHDKNQLSVPPIVAAHPPITPQTIATHSEPDTSTHPDNSEKRAAEEHSHPAANSSLSNNLFYVSDSKHDENHTPPKHFHLNLGFRHNTETIHHPLPNPQQQPDHQQSNQPPYSDEIKYTNTSMLTPNPDLFVMAPTPSLQQIKNALRAECRPILDNKFTDLIPPNLSAVNMEAFNQQVSNQDENETTVIETETTEFFMVLIAYETSRRALLESINNMSSSQEQEKIESQIEQFNTDSKEKFELLKQYYQKISVKKSYVKEIMASEEKLKDLFTPPTYKFKRHGLTPENDSLVIGPDGNYANNHHLVLARNEASHEGNTDDQKEEQKENVISFPPPFDQTLTDLYLQSKAIRIQIIAKIIALQPEQPPNNLTFEQEQKTLTENLVELSTSNALLAEKVTARKNYIQSRETLKLNLHLDIHNYQHLSNWARQNEPCFHGYGGVPVTVNDEKGEKEVFRIPSRIHHMMTIIDRNDYLDAESFESDFNQARYNKPGFFFNPLSSWTRNILTDTIYNEKRDIKNLTPFVKRS